MSPPGSDVQYHFTDSGPTAGGTPVTITGSNFVSGGSFGVTIGSVAASSVVRVDATHITAVTPAGTAGAEGRRDNQQ